MPAGVNRRWIVLQQPEGAPVVGKDIELREEPLPSEIKEGQILVRVTSMSLDPYMRGMMNKVAYGREMRYPRLMAGGAVGQVVESRNPGFQPGALVQGNFGWQDYAISSGQGVRVLPSSLASGFRPSWFLGALGMPGATAYYGLLEVCDPQPGETVVVSSCTGAVGSLVGQIAKIRGCRTVGLTSTSKVDLARSFGYDAVVDYSGKSVPELVRAVRAAAPAGVNCYFDNAGGPCTEAVLSCLARFARVSVCGQIAYYNLEDPLSASAYPATMVALTTSSKIEGFIVYDRPKASPGVWDGALADLAGWIQEGKLRVHEDVAQGLEHAFGEFMTLFHGLGASTNVGKKVLDIAEPPLPVPSKPAAKL